LIEKGLITREGFMQRISEETGDLSEATESDSAMNIGCACGSGLALALDRGGEYRTED
jgi:hypothetical protein